MKITGVNSQEQILAEERRAQETKNSDPRRSMIKIIANRNVETQTDMQEEKESEWEPRLSSFALESSHGIVPLPFVVTPTVEEASNPLPMLKEVSSHSLAQLTIPTKLQSQAPREVEEAMKQKSKKMSVMKIECSPSGSCP